MTTYFGSLLLDGEVLESSLFTREQVDLMIDAAKADSAKDGIEVKSESGADGTISIYRDVPCDIHGYHRQAMVFRPFDVS